MSSTFFTGKWQSTERVALVDQSAAEHPKPMTEINTNLVTPISSTFWVEGALELCELTCEPSYVLTDEIGGTPYSASFRWLVQMLQGEGPFWSLKPPKINGYDFSSPQGVIGNRPRLLVRKDYVQHPGSDPRILAQQSIYTYLLRDLRSG
ncbi:uncharacterized protein N7503_006411 [Penicillium pulvis]|uniref:uncharacterized protein n=1 Tax=Penicillium pulvis TaxID=1562058 RepID=UPI002546F51D|nr:uncharacterized protein N7503_006411 [Penicillium pulvis]KAJ5798906.1 hypothetical protein N7503_006411 [Penicillium pulvis]